MKHEETASRGIWWLLLPLFLYYFVNNAVVWLGIQGVELQSEMRGQERAVLEMYLKTAVKMAGMFFGGVAVYPFYRKLAYDNLQLKQRYEKREILQTVIMGAVWGAGLNLVFFLLGFTQSSDAYSKVAESQFAIPIWLAVFFYGILSPVVEEIVFRGILYRGLKQTIGRNGAILSSALLFGVFHGNIVQAAYGSIMGIFLAIYYEKYGKIAAPVLFHSAANVVVYMLSSL